MSGDHGVGRMTSDSGNPVGLLAEKARNARLRRLEKQKKNSGMLKCGFTPEIALDVAGEGVSGVKKRRTTGFQDVPSIENRASVEGDVALKQCSSGSSDQSSATDGSPAKHLMRGGEVIGEDESVSLASLLHGSISVIGRRRAMEDAVTVAPEIFAGEFAFFAVYDGHGGAAVASACRDRLHLLLAKELEGNSSPEIRTAVGRRFDWEKVMAACFAKMDEEVTAGTDVPAETVGSTAVVVVVSKTEVVIANCGDSRAVIGRGGAAVPLSHDHKPHRTDERERVEAAGGRVIDWNGCRVQGVLATSRSIGDRYLRPYVISDPEIVVSERTSSDEFLIIATDGLWDVISNETACDVVRKSLGKQLRWRFSDSNCAIEAAAVLAELAIAKGSKDNISVIVVELKKSR